jgi:addiction module RelE/StbE family toxin
MRLIRAASYHADLNAIVDYIARDNPDSALAIWDRIESRVERLASFPKSGRSGRIEGTRELVVTGTPFIVAYRITGETIIVLRVLHGARQWPDEFRD